MLAVHPGGLLQHPPWPLKNSQHWLFFPQGYSTPCRPHSPQRNSQRWLFHSCGTQMNSHHLLFILQGYSTHCKGPTLCMPLHSTWEAEDSPTPP